MIEESINPIIKMSLKEFQEMCNRAGVKKESLCETVFTRQFKKKENKMKIYKGRRLNPEKGTISNIVVTVNSEPLKHRVYHSPDGFNWGYGGSGPADLARSILWDFIGTEPTPGLYQDFKFHFVSGWKDEWQITSEEIQNWLDKIRQKKVIK